MAPDGSIDVSFILTYEKLEHMKVEPSVVDLDGRALQWHQMLKRTRGHVSLM